MRFNFGLRNIIGILLLCIPVTTLAQVAVSVSPTSDTVLPGSVRSVYSNVQGATNVAVIWASTGGPIVSSTGFVTWTAPASPGTYTVTATSLEDATKTASTTFTVVKATVRTSNIPMQATIFKNQPLVIQSILWGSTNTAVAWINSGGALKRVGREAVFKASVAGTYTVTAISLADKAKKATTTIVVTDNPWPGVATHNKTQPIDCTPTGNGTTYEVQSEAGMDAVPWSSLGPGDTVRIHAGPVYHKQILISTSGTETQPIRVCGVPDTNGNLPEINGSDATAKAGSAYGSPHYTLQKYGGIVIYKYGAGYYSGSADYPKNIIIEGLKVTGFRKENKFYDLLNGNVLNPYNNGAAPVRIQHGRNITLRGNMFLDSGNGLFVMTNNGIESQATRNFLVEGNYFQGNGNYGGTYEHQSYIQALGLVVQGNYYDLPIVGTLGSQLKTRSVQQFVRYNYFEPAGRIIDFVEIEDSKPLVFPWVGLDAGELVNTSPTDVVAHNEGYQDRFVYGNVFNNRSLNPSFKTSVSIVHGSADNDQRYQPGGVLYFYHNTVVNTLVSSETSNWRTKVIDFGPYGTAIEGHTSFPSARLTNNVFYIFQSSPASGRLFFWNNKQPDRVQLDKNWVSNGWGTGDISGGDGSGISNSPGDNPLAVWQGGSLATQVSGVPNLITGSSQPFESGSYAPVAGGPLVLSSVALPGLAAALPPLMQYSPSTSLMSDRTNTLDIGAIGIDWPSPPFMLPATPHLKNKKY